MSKRDVPKVVRTDQELKDLKAEFLEMFPSTLSAVAVCEKLNIPYYNYKNWKRQDPEFKAELMEMKEELALKAESVIYDVLSDAEISKIERGKLAIEFLRVNQLAAKSLEIVQAQTNQTGQIQVTIVRRNIEE